MKDLHENERGWGLEPIVRAPDVLGTCGIAMFPTSHAIERCVVHIVESCITDVLVNDATQYYLEPKLIFVVELLQLQHGKPGHTA